MADVKTRATIQQRGDTAANWAALNPVPLVRELVLETDTNKFKIGNGVTAYNSLPYVSGATGAAGPTGPAGTLAVGASLDDVGRFDFGHARVQGAATTPIIMSAVMSNTGAPTASGFVENAAAATYAARTNVIRFSTSAATGQIVETRVSGPMLHFGGDAQALFRFRISVPLTGDERWFVGLTPQSTVASTNTSLTTQALGAAGTFGVGRQDASNNVHVVYTSGTPSAAMTRSVVDLGATMNALGTTNDWFEVALKCVEGVATYSVSTWPGTTTGSHRTAMTTVSGTVPVTVTGFYSVAPRIFLTNDTVAAIRSFDYTTITWRQA